MHGLLLALAFMVRPAASQDPASGYEAFAARLQNNVNSGQYAAVADDFDDQMRRLLPPEKAGSVLKGLFGQYGRILSYDPPRPAADGWTVLTAHCQEGTLDVKVALNSDNQVSGLYFLPHPTDIPALPRNASPLSLPFRGTWLVIWGGDTKELNYHHGIGSQNYAFDILAADDQGKTHRGDGSANADYYAYGRAILAPGDGVVIKTIDGVAENVPGVMNEEAVVGNAVLIQHGPGEVSLLAHLIPGSLKVKAGDKVSRGQQIARCGNSGHSTEPHLHYQLQSLPSMADAIGIKVYFSQLMLTREGQPELKLDYSPIQGDLISPE